MKFIMLEFYLLLIPKYSNRKICHLVLRSTGYKDFFPKKKIKTKSPFFLMYFIVLKHFARGPQGPFLLQDHTYTLKGIQKCV